MQNWQRRRQNNAAGPRHNERTYTALTSACSLFSAGEYSMARACTRVVPRLKKWRGTAAAVHWQRQSRSEMPVFVVVCRCLLIPGVGGAHVQRQQLLGVAGCVELLGREWRQEKHARG